jgi:hypothetical protein
MENGFNVEIPKINLSDLINSSNQNNINFSQFMEKVKYGNAETKNNGWSSSKEDKISMWIEENQIYSWLLSRAGEHYNKQNKWIMIPLIIVSAITTVSTIGSAGVLDKDDLKIFVLVIGVVNSFVLFLALLKQLLDPEQLASKLSNISKKYSIMNNHLSEVLSENIHERPNGTVYCRQMNDARNALIEETPAIPNSIWNLFYKKLEAGEVLDIESSILVKNEISKKRKEKISKDSRDTNKHMKNNKSTKHKNTFDSESNNTYMLTDITKDNTKDNPNNNTNNLLDETIINMDGNESSKQITSHIDLITSDESDITTNLPKQTFKTEKEPRQPMLFKNNHSVDLGNISEPQSDTDQDTDTEQYNNNTHTNVNNNNSPVIQRIRANIAKTNWVKSYWE